MQAPAPYISSRVRMTTQDGKQASVSDTEIENRYKTLHLINLSICCLNKNFLDLLRRIGSQQIVSAAR